MELIKPKTVSVTDADGESKDFTISRLPATVGREILAKYPVGLMGKGGSYDVSEDAMLLLMSYVAVEIDGEPFRLKTKALIDNHVPDTESLVRLELEMIMYNTSFFGKKKLSSFQDYLLLKVKDFIPKIIETLTPLSQSSSPKDTQRSRSLKKN
jgi:hypothetical protein